MKITLEVFGSLRQHLPGYDRERGLEIEIPAGTRLSGLFARLNLPVSESNMVTVDGHLAEEDEPLTPGASVLVLPHVGGG
jgi:molybdopterin converting factor small subunit